ncbi:GntR family transcriptional regulator [Nocardioides marmoriginsengisoli]|nr:GntR family transcriptional regulator [Nocardioides marmoriginsengisoli]
MVRRLEPVPTRTEAVLAALRDALLAGDLENGTQVNIEELSRRFGVSRGPLREALNQLEGEGQVGHVARRGFVIPGMTTSELYELDRIRTLLEAEAARSAVPVLRASDLDVMRAAARENREALVAGDRITAAHANRRFHFALFEASGKYHLLDAIVRSWNTDGYRSLYFADLTAALRVTADHDAILEAASAGDADEVVRLQDRHRAKELALVMMAIRRRGGGPLPVVRGSRSR